MSEYRICECLTNDDINSWGVLRNLFSMSTAGFATICVVLFNWSKTSLVNLF